MWDYQDPNCVLIIDAAQMTYRNEGLWGFFQDVSSEPEIPRARVILFANHGSPSGLLNQDSICVKLNPSQRVSLLPDTTNDASPPVGLFLTEEEFPPFINKMFKAGHFDDSFYRWVYEVTAGHIGAITDVIRFAKTQDVRIQRVAFDKLT
jgi:hypothetical protein